ncbi:MarR family winged helix-turn-helix transcriptional regulator [Cellulomonas uda]|uniref:MarR family transcriptional regulator n=1 Tax=Cellulomonas uda TaxID=1714 RepID=A0A4Y3K587_CELUD|nr:MarR family winged helix-turn-helix transcriptional regulator [Cellulomonas uda]NII66616.1 DNA-binding MarR family transcriptional regulator [Cellulomonas uda]GEA79661.1 MarR family transcriptional regulator [Cellulomonas uda]
MSIGVSRLVVMSRSGADLALLLLGGFRTLVDGAMVELAARGYDDFRPTHEFAMRAIIAGADSASDVARRLSVSKQAAAKTVAVLVARGYVSSEPDPSDARRNRLQVTARGCDVLREGEAVFEDMRARWEEKLGAAELAHLEASLAALVGDSAVDPGAPGWVGQDTVAIEHG